MKHVISVGEKELSFTTKPSNKTVIKLIDFDDESDISIIIDKSELSEMIGLLLHLQSKMRSNYTTEVEIPRIKKTADF
jgi:hypothetical protein